MRRSPGARRRLSLSLASPPWRAGRGRCPACCSALAHLQGRPVGLGSALEPPPGLRRSGRGRLQRDLAPLLWGGRGLTRPREGAGPDGGGSAGTWRGRALGRLQRCAGGAEDVVTPGLGQGAADELSRALQARLDWGSLCFAFAGGSDGSGRIPESPLPYRLPSSFLLFLRVPPGRCTWNC